MAAAQYAGVTLIKRLYLYRGLIFARPWRRSRPGPPGSALSVMMVVSGGLGDLIVIGRFLRDLAATVEPFTFDVFTAMPHLARWVYADIPGFRDAYPDVMQDVNGTSYDIRLFLSQLAIVQHESVQWWQLKKAKRFLEVVLKMEKMRRQELEPYVQYHPRMDNGLARLAVYRGRSRRDFLHYTAGLEFGGNRLDIEADDTIIERLGLSSAPYITVHNGFDTNFVVSTHRATKCYPHFSDVIAHIKQKRPELIIVQLGTVTSDHISTVDLNLIGKTNLKEVAGLLKKSILHLDNEGGLVHLSASLGGRSLVVFGPTPSDYFGYPENINVDPINCGGCWCIDELWMNRCMRGETQPVCVFDQPPGRVADMALKVLARLLKSH
ncbi:MAG: glycosyltransferase family 9 protein [Rhizobiales bacterium]|nr:glycosyltransferase family 9 protein [Hyphomicrobiales bacterium]